ncbi:MAG: DUF2892 domain-containing protein [Hyphomonadaceae bacterium JAD_PAG50586_4]|nr:MAG: DUF2892 domain-containing protein [Hyphomonadaceae bacterium JAD_PAG50586_4]
MDRIIRVIAGLAIISLVFVGPQNLWGWLGLMPWRPQAIVIELEGETHRQVPHHRPDIGHGALSRLSTIFDI